MHYEDQGHYEAAMNAQAQAESEMAAQAAEGEAQAEQDRLASEETEVEKLPLPKKIGAVNYAGFFDFSEKGMYDASVINAMDYPNAEQIADEIARRYNEFPSLKEQLSSYEESYNNQCKRIDELNEQLSLLQEENKKFESRLSEELRTSSQRSLMMVRSEEENNKLQEQLKTKDQDIEELKKTIVYLANCNSERGSQVMQAEDSNKELLEALKEIQRFVPSLIHIANKGLSYPDNCVKALNAIQPIVEKFSGVPKE